MAKVYLKQGRAKPLWHGHPWVYAQAIKRIEGNVVAGDIVDVHDHKNIFVGRGSINPDSAIAVRLLTRDPLQAIDQPWIYQQLEAALKLRRRLGLPSAETNCFRWVNSEGDGLSGLVVDVYGRAVAVQFTARGMHRMSGWIFDAITELFSPEVLAEVTPGAFAATEGIATKPRLVAGQRPTTRCVEHGISYAVDLLGGQKTGLFLDQRENHQFVRGLAGAGRVLDLYAYHGAFALNAARGGASHVTAVDASSRAVAAIEQNARENRVELETVEADAFRYLESVPDASIDLMVLDPPKFARSRRELNSALKGYRKLHQRAIKALTKRGLLCSAVCSQLVSLEDLQRIVANAAVEQGRDARLLEVRGSGADHPRPPAFGEGDYLKFIVCEIA